MICNSNVKTYVNETDELVHIFVNGEEIICTPTHPFYNPVKGWTDAVHLRAGDILVLVNGEYVVVEKVQHELLENPVKVYNFQVEDYHTYYVSESGVLVHNDCRYTDTQKGIFKEAKDASKTGLSRADALELLRKAQDNGIPNHEPMMHPGRQGHWANIEHIKIGKYHIEIISG